MMPARKPPRARTPIKKADDDGHQDAQHGHHDQFPLGRDGADAHNHIVGRFDSSFHHTGDLELLADFLDDQTGRALNSPQQDGAEQEGQSATDQQTHKNQWVSDVEAFYLQTCDLDEGGEQAQGRDHG